jgi:hypothetical protein
MAMPRQRRDDRGPGAVTPQGHPTDQAATAKQQAEPSCMLAHCHDALDNPAEAERLIALSDERDLWQRLCLSAFREGWQAAEQAHADDYDLGYVDGLLRRKHIEHDAVEAAKLEVLRWGPGGREHYADPRPGDYPGREAARCPTA